jgi:hypothetical protein
LSVLGVLALICYAPWQAASRKHLSSLARTSGVCATLFVVCGCVGAHAMMAYAQLTGTTCSFEGSAATPACPVAPNASSSDALMEAIFDASFSYRADGLVRDALSAAADVACYEHGEYIECGAEGATQVLTLESRDAACTLLQCGRVAYDATLFEFTYGWSLVRQIPRPIRSRPILYHLIPTNPVCCI